MKLIKLSVDSLFRSQSPRTVSLSLCVWLTFCHNENAEIEHEKVPHSHTLLYIHTLVLIHSIFVPSEWVCVFCIEIHSLDKSFVEKMKWQNEIIELFRYKNIVNYRCFSWVYSKCTLIPPPSSTQHTYIHIYTLEVHSQSSSKQYSRIMILQICRNKCSTYNVLPPALHAIAIFYGENFHRKCD